MYCVRRDSAKKKVGEPAPVARAAREDSTDSLLPIARQPLAVLAGVARVVAEPSRHAREARVSKIRVPDKDHKCQESRRVARDEQPGPGTHCKVGLELSLTLST